MHLAWDSASGDLGIAVQSKFPNVGGIVPWARAGVGAVATPEIVRQLEPILLREPLHQPEKWLATPQGRATPVFPRALENFMYWENYDVRVRSDGKIDRVDLEYVLRRRGSGPR